MTEVPVSTIGAINGPAEVSPSTAPLVVRLPPETLVGRVPSGMLPPTGKSGAVAGGAVLALVVGIVLLWRAS